jgi:drug/metabolite transporter (DMT)-like permease
MRQGSAPHAIPTGLGFLTIALWGTSIAVNRIVVENIGLLRGPLISTAVSGAIGVALLLIRRGEAAKLARLPAAYWAVCGSLFVGYTLAYNIGVGLARGGRQVLLFGILNYLWPALTVAFSAAIFRRRVKPWFFAGLALAAGAIVLAFVSRPGVSAISFAGVAEDLRANPLAFVLGLFCGVSWALYSNLGRKIAGSSDANPVPVLVLAASAVFAVATIAGAGGPAVQGPPRWTAGTAGALVWRALLVDLAAYVFWDAAMRRGNQLLVAAVSLFTPLLSTGVIAILLGEPPGALFWIACVVAVAGAWVCRSSVEDQRGDAERRIPGGDAERRIPGGDAERRIPSDRR